jgi:predicted protein tyrosine phosphatase
MNIRVLDLADAEAYEPGPNEVCISITSPTIRAELQGGWRAVLPLQFSDIDVVLPARWNVASATTLFTGKMAHEVVKFAREHADADFVVHCEAGVSRSPGVALALHEILTGEPPGATIEQRYSLHNRFVRRKVLESRHVFSQGRGR